MSEPEKTVPFRVSQGTVEATRTPWKPKSCCREIHFEVDEAERQVKCLKCGTIHSAWNALILVLMRRERLTEMVKEINAFNQKQHEKAQRRRRAAQGKEQGT